MLREEDLFQPKVEVWMKPCCVRVLPTRLKVMRQCLQAWDSYFGLGLFQVRYNQAGWWPQHLKEELTCIRAGGRKRGDGRKAVPAGQEH